MSRIALIIENAFAIHFNTFQPNKELNKVWSNSNKPKFKVIFGSWTALIANNAIAGRFDMFQPNEEPNYIWNDLNPDLSQFCVLDYFNYKKRICYSF